MSLSNSWLKYLKSSLLKFIIKLSNKELKLLMLKSIYFSNPLSMAFTLKLNLDSSCLIR